MLFLIRSGRIVERASISDLCHSPCCLGDATARLSGELDKG